MSKKDIYKLIEKQNEHVCVLMKEKNICFICGKKTTIKIEQPVKSL